jgi:hypothetical protein
MDKEIETIEMELNRFRVFYGGDFYPDGGYWDYKAHFKTLNAAKEYIEKISEDEFDRWAHIVHKDKIILKGHKENRSDEWIWIE